MADVVIDPVAGEFVSGYAYSTYASVAGSWAYDYPDDGLTLSSHLNITTYDPNVGVIPLTNVVTDGFVASYAYAVGSAFSGDYRSSDFVPSLALTVTSYRPVGTGAAVTQIWG